MSIKHEFKDFISRGNVIDLAVAVVMGAAFGKIVSSLVADILTPPIGYLIGGIRFTDLKVTLPAILGKVPATINYGNFLQAIFDFLIVSVSIFGVVKLVKILKLQKKAEKPVTGPTDEVKLLIEIRDLLKK
ncbi:MAG: large-conductance mechanosensitive channel protein MscL [Myxococcota bacterium]